MKYKHALIWNRFLGNTHLRVYRLKNMAYGGCACACPRGPGGQAYIRGVCTWRGSRAPVDRPMRPSRYHAYLISCGRILIALDADDIGFN